MGREDNHVYQVDEGREPGTWGPFCVGCSYLAGHYVYPCRLDVDNDERVIPTMPLYTPEKVQDMINEVLAAMVNDGKALLAPPGKVIAHNAGEYRFVDGEPLPKLIPLDLSLDVEPNAFGQAIRLIEEEEQ